MEGSSTDIFIVLITCKAVKRINPGYDVCTWDSGSSFTLSRSIIGFWT